MKIAKESADSLLTLLNDILDPSKIEARRLEVETVDFSLRDTLDNATRGLSMRAQEKGIELACHVSSNVPDTLRGDPARLRQIVINLVGNAIKFTPEGEVTVRIELAKDKGSEAELHFVVTDTGVGIPKEKQKAIFEAFTQADSSTTRKYGGTGLGLAISSQLIQIMGGRIWVESEEGRGTAFHFTMSFPLQEAATKMQAIADEP